MMAGPLDLDAVAVEVERFRRRLRRRLAIGSVLAFLAFIAYELFAVLTH